MNLFDPNRPKIASGRAKLLVSHHNIVPSFDMELINSDTIELQVMLKPDYDRGYIWYRAEVKLSDLAQMLADYISDPEKVLIELFNYDPEKIVVRPVQSAKAPTIRATPHRRDQGTVHEIDLDALDDL